MSQTTEREPCYAHSNTIRLDLREACDTLQSLHEDSSFPLMLRIKLSTWIFDLHAEMDRICAGCPDCRGIRNTPEEDAALQ